MIVITGASSGLGASLAKRYALQGERVLITGRSKQKLESVLDGMPTTSACYACDLTDHFETESLFSNIKTPPHTIIHCAGSGYFGAIDDQEPNKIRTLIDNNLHSAINVLREAVRRYQDKPVTIVMVMSTAALQPKAGESTYCAAKWAVKGLIESVRLELKSKPMKVVAVYPGGMDTEFWPTSGKSLDTHSFMHPDEVAEMIHSALQQVGNGYVSDITVNRI